MPIWPEHEQERAQEHRALYSRYAPAVAYVEVELPNGDRSIGTAFHVGEGVFLTARHVVENNRILSVATTVDHYLPDPSGGVTIHGYEGKYRSVRRGDGRLRSGPHFHPEPGVDVAALVVDGIEAPVIPLGSHLDDWLVDEDFILRMVVLMGYPPIPRSTAPVLVSTRAEVNAVIDRYDGRHPHFIVSSIARGGFSGGPCLIEGGFALGLVTQSLLVADQPPELGYAAVITVEPLYVCLQEHGLVPAVQKEGWDGLWDDTSPVSKTEP